MPAVLSEISFVSNAADERLLLDPSQHQRQRIAEALFEGISTYLSRTPATTKADLFTFTRSGNPKPL